MKKEKHDNEEVKDNEGEEDDEFEELDEREPLKVEMKGLKISSDEEEGLNWVQKESKSPLLKEKS